MEKVISKYYDGFEGEPEIRFIQGIDNEEKQVLSIWEGYFDKIMNVIIPEQTGWTGLAYFYHLHEGWYEESPWQIQSIDNVCKQLKGIDINALDRDTQNVLNDILEFLESAQLQKHNVWIAYE
jgi:hypothetical protein